MNGFKIEVEEITSEITNKVIKTIFHLTKDGQILDSATYSQGRFDNAKFTPQAMKKEASRLALTWKKMIADGTFA